MSVHSNELTSSGLDITHFKSVFEQVIARHPNEDARTLFLQKLNNITLNNSDKVIDICFKSNILEALRDTQYDN